MTNAVNLAQAGNSNSSLGFKNRIINGAMVIDQRNAGAAVTINAAAVTYTLDRWRAFGVASAGVYTVQQNSGSVTPPAGYSNYLGIKTTTADASVAAGSLYFLGQFIEGFNFSDLAFGTANAKTLTISFWVYSSLTGTFGGSLSNSAYNRSYPFTYTVSSANTWQQISITIAGDTTGTWVGGTNGIGVSVNFDLGSGSSNLSTAGAWAGAGYIGATGDTKIIGTLNAVWYITGVQLEVGSTATQFDYRDYGRELIMCQRYYAKLGGTGASGYMAIGSGIGRSGTLYSGYIKFPVTMRTAPTLAISGAMAMMYSGDNWVNISTIASTYGGYDSTLFQGAVASSVLSAGMALVITQNADSAAFIAMASEL